MPDKRLYDEATKASAEEGIVILDGPDGVAVSLTPAAAQLSGSRISDAAAKAQRQRPARPAGKGD